MIKNEYKIPGSLTIYQREMYEHLINWKWKNITSETGSYNYGNRVIEYDTLLPLSLHEKFPLIYPAILSDLYWI